LLEYKYESFTKYLYDLSISSSILSYAYQKIFVEKNPFVINISLHKKMLY